MKMVIGALSICASGRRSRTRAPTSCRFAATYAARSGTPGPSAGTIPAFLLEPLRFIDERIRNRAQRCATKWEFGLGSTPSSSDGRKPSVIHQVTSRFRGMEEVGDL
jgi:hypothetical protein